MAEVWVIGADGDGSATLAALLRAARHEVRTIDDERQGTRPRVVLVGAFGDEHPEGGSVERADVALLVVHRPFSPAEVLEAVDAAVADGVEADLDPMIDLVEPEPVDLIERLDALVTDLHRVAESAANGRAVHYEAALHQLYRANVTLLEAFAADAS